MYTRCFTSLLPGVVFYELVTAGGFPQQLPPGLETTAAIHLSTLPVSFGLLAFVFAGHAVFPAIYTSMEEPEEYEAGGGGGSDLKTQTAKLF